MGESEQSGLLFLLLAALAFFLLLTVFTLKRLLCHALSDKKQTARHVCRRPKSRTRTVIVTNMVPSDPRLTATVNPSVLSIEAPPSYEEVMRQRY